MAIISDEQMRFLKRHSIPLSQVFDASGMQRYEYQASMHELDMLVAIGVSPCDKLSHTMKWRTGHCAQCNTHVLAFSRRLKEAGDVYVAESKSSGLVKIGTAWDAHARMTTLNNFEYGGVSDWMIRYCVSCDMAGKVEFEAQRLLQDYQISKSYLKSSRKVDCQELFVCDSTFAYQAVRTALERLDLGLKEKIPGISSLGMFNHKPLPEARAYLQNRLRLKNAKPTHPNGNPSAPSVRALKTPKIPKRKGSVQKLVIEIKGRVYVKDLADRMGVKPRQLMQDLISMKYYAKLDEELSRSVAVALCKKHKFTLVP